MFCVARSTYWLVGEGRERKRRDKDEKMRSESGEKNLVRDGEQIVRVEPTGEGENE